MAKKRPIPKQRTDPERRARQSERLSRLLRVLHCIMGPGRWDAEALARDLEVSPRTIHRIMQTLSMANVPWYFCKESECYRVRPGYRFPGFEPTSKVGDEAIELRLLMPAARQLLEDGEKFISSLRQFCNSLNQNTTTKPGPS